MNNPLGNSIGEMFGSNQLIKASETFMNEWKRSDFYTQFSKLLIEREERVINDSLLKKTLSLLNFKKEFHSSETGESFGNEEKRKIQDRLAKMADQIQATYGKVLDKNETIIEQLNILEKEILDKKGQCVSSGDLAKIAIIEEKYRDLDKYFQKMNACDLFYFYYKVFIKLIPKSNKVEFERKAMLFIIEVQEKMAMTASLKRELDLIGNVKKKSTKKISSPNNVLESTSPTPVSYANNVEGTQVGTHVNSYVQQCLVRARNILDGLQAGRPLNKKTKDELYRMQDKLNKSSFSGVGDSVEGVAEVIRQIFEYSQKQKFTSIAPKQTKEKSNGHEQVKEISSEQKLLKEVFDALIDGISSKVSSTRIKGTNSCGDGTFTNKIFLPIMRHFSNDIIGKNILEFPLSLADLGTMYLDSKDEKNESMRSFVLLMNNYSQKRNNVKDVIMDFRGVISDFAKGSYFHKKSRNNLLNFLQRFDKIVEDYFQ